MTKTTPTVLVGRFRIIRMLGRGGMGEVYLAEDPLLNRAVALKLLTTAAHDDAERRHMFKREAESAAALNHPNICTIFEVGDADGRPYIAMEAIDGRSLKSLLSEGPLSADVMLPMAMQVASALEHAHDRHVVHRDLTSANVMITPKGLVKVLDFGLAKRVTLDGASASETTQWVSQTGIAGTFPYMAPEHALGRPVDHRSDLFSLGIVLYETLTGRLPFAGSTSTEVVNAIINSNPPPIESLNARVPAALAGIVEKLLEKDPARRYQSASDVASDLRELEATGDLRRRRTAAARRRVQRIVAGTAAVVAAAILGIWWRTHRIQIFSAATVREAVVVPAAVAGPPEFQFLADAIPNSLTSRLTQRGVFKLKVPPTSSEFTTVGRSVARVADSYHVALCIVPRAAVTSGRLIVNIQVVEPRLNEVVWSGESEGAIDQYGESLERAVDALTLALRGSARPSRPVPPSADNTALELAIGRGVYYGRNFNRTYRPGDYDLAEAAYHEALRIAPHSAAAASGLAYLEIFQMQGGQPPQRALPKLDEWARRAVDFDLQHPLGWAALAVAENWRQQPDSAKQLEYGFRAASLGEACGPCQLALMEGTMPFSQMLAYHVAEHDAEIDPLAAYGHLNSAVALTALGRFDQASAAIARAASIEPDALWVSVLRALTAAAAGSSSVAATEASSLMARDTLKTLPAFVTRLLRLVRAEPDGDDRRIAEAVEALRDPVRRGQATSFELQYVTIFATPILARAGRTAPALALLTEITSAGAPPPYDMLMLNPLVKRLSVDPRARSIVAKSKLKFAFLRKAIEDARSAGRFPRYLEQPLNDLLTSLRDFDRTT